MVARVALDGGGGDAGLELGDGVVPAAAGDGDDELEPGAGLPDEDLRRAGFDDHAASAHVRDQGSGGGHDEFLQPVQVDRAVAEEEEPASYPREGDSPDQGR